MKRLIPLLLAAALFLCGCRTAGVPASAKKTVVCTVFAVYDMAKTLAEGTDTDVCLLTDGGADIHSFQPTAKDMRTLGDASLVVYLGGESDAWIADTVGNGQDSLALMAALSADVKDEAYENGFVGEGSAEETEEADEKDEHIWLSPRLAMGITRALSDALCDMDVDNAAVYRANAEQYLSLLSALDERFAETAENAAARVLVIPDRFPFRYLADDYGITCFAAYPGCSAETGASFDTVKTLADALDTYDLNAVCVTETADRAIADAVIAASGRKAIDVVTMDSMQSTRTGDGKSYLSVMEENRAALSKLLGERK